MFRGVRGCGGGPVVIYLLVIGSGRHGGVACRYFVGESFESDGLVPAV